MELNSFNLAFHRAILRKRLITMSLEAIKAAIPHREPFLLIDEIVEQTENHIVCRKKFTGKEFWYAGHYPEFPLTPGVLLCEAAMQAGAVLLAKVVADNPDRVPVVSRMNNVKFKAMVRPGDTVTLDVNSPNNWPARFSWTPKCYSTTKPPSRSTSPAKWPHAITRR